ncbi:MAG: ZIP family metal transporter [Betaproteobacteria bacterium]|nr:MAG: ZIP family metal transporter [Betaproteobacteria bacterium]
MILFDILLATFAAGVLSVLLAATLALTWLPRFADRMVAFAVGVMLTFAFTRMLPEAVEMGVSAESVGQITLAGIIVFFLLEKAALWRHSHGEAPVQCDNPGHDHHHHASRATMIVLGDGLHNFVDGILIAAAFLADPHLGWATVGAVLAHELPQEIGDFMVLLGTGMSKGRALLLNALSGTFMIAGGVLGYFTLDHMKMAVPYVLVVAAASFIYIAVADLVPELHRHRRFKDAIGQLTLMLIGVASVYLITGLGHHSH